VNNAPSPVLMRQFGPRSRKTRDHITKSEVA
jgi:hypothetical protein